MMVHVTETHIALGRRASAYAGPLSLAIADAYGPDERGHLPLVAVDKGPALTPIFDSRCMPDADGHRTAWMLRLPEQSIPLPWRAQVFQNVWEYGPQSGPFTIIFPDGTPLAVQTYCEIIVPFCFDLPLEAS